mmetsp:Transcript_4037/g.7405  ORF Transcript_4037/g.7405 Transcript_4037/m.7405 type:complete len:151 (-) Transcript_4037:139-591(-)
MALHTAATQTVAAVRAFHVVVQRSQHRPWRAVLPTHLRGRHHHPAPSPIPFQHYPSTRIFSERKRPASGVVLAATADDTVELKIEGMMCEGCTSRVTEALQAVSEVQSAAVTLEPGAATVELKKGSSKEEAVQTLVQTVVDLGFEAKQAA